MFVHLLQEQVSSSMCIVYTCRSTCTCTCIYVQRSFHLQQPFNATTAHTHTVYDVYVQTIKYVSLHGAGLICIYSIQATEGYVSLCSTVYCTCTI